METSCLIVWAESSQSEEESTDKATERCIKFTENMFKKCPLDSLEPTKVDVTVTFSELFEGTKHITIYFSSYLVCVFKICIMFMIQC